VCGVEKPLTDFYAMAGMRDGHRNDCKDCHRAAKRARYAEDPAKYVAMVKRWQAANPDRVRATRTARNRQPDRRRKQPDTYYRRTCGISADEVDEMLEAQGGGCAICGDRPERSASMHLDHDHEHHHLRDLLCLSCNQGLGKFRDDPQLLARAVEYLRRTRLPSLGRVGVCGHGQARLASSIWASSSSVKPARRRICRSRGDFAST
jgi:hypothetical protein